MASLPLTGKSEVQGGIRPPECDLLKDLGLSRWKSLPHSDILCFEKILLQHGAPAKSESADGNEAGSNMRSRRLELAHRKMSRVCYSPLRWFRRTVRLGRENDERRAGLLPDHMVLFRILRLFRWHSENNTLEGAP
ncbi:hypothetical protein JZ751_001652 [Albula glossodonta]|uniref:Uncharacterized protein n=1 Tax=Albula glossodonta TaxID=121402 RepID=A0A8T2PUB4_9TELE|nr:hypothetical protein JZ751_001652 [Albula glossodonta]